jgi:hypothetical protein
VVTYVNPAYPIHEFDDTVAWLKETHGEDTEIILTDIFKVAWIDNCLSVQNQSRDKGREDLVRPLDGK